MSGQTVISLSLGEPQHPVPEFVGPVLAKYTAEFGRYPIAKGIEPFRKAAADWCARRFKLPRPLDVESEVLVLNGSREGLFFAAIAAERFVGPRRGKPAVLVPNPFYPGVRRRRPLGQLRDSAALDRAREQTFFPISTS